MEYYLNYSPSRYKAFSEDYRQKILELLESSGAVGINCNYKFAGSQLSNLLHKNGYKLSVWTVDSSRTTKRMLMLKPDNITTKKPDMIEDIIENWGNN